MSEAADATPPVLPVRAGYDRWSAVYDSDGNPLVALEEQHVLPLYGELRGARALDLGCGTGRHALRLAAGGARVLGLDLSGGMLQVARTRAQALARELEAPLALELCQHDLATRLPCGDGLFDLVVAGLVLEHLSALRAFFAEIERVLAPRGRALLSTLHPAMRLRGTRARFTDPETGLVTHVEGEPQAFAPLVLAALHGGLALTHLSEHAPEPELARRFPRAEKYIGWPMLLVLGLERR